MEIAQTSMILPTIPSGAAIANPLGPVMPTEKPPASRIKAQDAMNKLVRKCCNVTHPSVHCELLLVLDCGSIGQNFDS